MRFNPVRYRSVRILVYLLMMVPFVLTMGAAEDGSAQEEGEGLVYKVLVHNEIERGLRVYMERAFAEAEEAGADHIVLDINTPGGAVQAADEIGQLLQDTDTPVTAYVNPNATSAGAYIALNADNIVFSTGGTMGSAAVVDLEGNAGDQKVTAFWVSKMENAAEINDRDPQYARAMVDPAVEIEGLVNDEQLLDFSASQATEHGYAEAVAENEEEVLAFLELEGARVETIEYAVSEYLARFITNPIVASILMSLAGLGLILELYSPGFGVSGSIGLASLLLFFFGHMIAGFAGWEALILFFIGLVLIVIEIFVAGFGIFGILGIAAVAVSLAMASENVIAGLTHMGIALVVTLIAMVILAKYLNKRGVWSKLVLNENLSTAEGEHTYKQKNDIIGKRGLTVTPLRPSGTVKINGQQYDVVSGGGFVEKGVPVQVQAVDGPRIVVSEVEEEEADDEPTPTFQ